MSTPPTEGRPLRTRLAVVGLVVAAVYAATSANWLLKPSAHFHFVDMAESFLHKRLDTDTPRRSAGQRPKPDDPPGFQEAVERATRDGRGNAVGWNDWASYRVMQLKGGEVVRGVFPWKDQPGSRAHEFHALDGRVMLIDPDKDVRVGNCTGLAGISGVNPTNTFRKCDDVVYQVSFPPFPAVAMLPLVALWHYKLNDVLFTLAWAVAAAMLWLAWLARSRRDGLTAHDDREQHWLAALFAFGTVAWFCSIRGEVWFTAQIMGLALHVAYLLAARGAERPLLAGVIMAAGVATRTPLLFSAAVFLPLEALFPDGQFLGRGWRKAAVQLGLYALPLLAMGAALAWFNYARWGNPTEFGHYYLLEGTRAPTREHGLFSFWFLNHNLGTGLLNLPQLSFDAPFVLITRHGLGLLACTPVLATLLGRGPDRDASPRESALFRHLLWTALAVALPGFLYQNDGWQQFGYRFALDFLPPLLAAFAVATPTLTRKHKALIVLGMVVNLFGAVTFGRMDQFYYD